MLFAVSIASIVFMVMIFVVAALFIALAYPVVSHKINLSVAGVVTPTMFAPMLLMSWRNIQIYWFLLHSNGLLNNHNGLRVYQPGRRIVTNIDPSIDSRLIYANGHTDVWLGKAGCSGAQGDRKKPKSFHKLSPNSLSMSNEWPVDCAC
jgi:uncharacterized membrane protein